VATKPESWFVSPLDEAELGRETLPQLLVLERQAAMIQAMEGRINRALAKEKARQAAEADPYLDPEIRDPSSARVAQRHHECLPLHPDDHVADAAPGGHPALQRGDLGEEGRVRELAA
jgi:hypothetical protein